MKRLLKCMARPAMLMAVGLAVAANGNAPNEALRSDGAWERLEEGLELGLFPSPQPSESGDSLIRVLRIDPRRFELRLLNASASEDRQSLTAREWSERNGLVAVINASMYQKDQLTSVAMMRTKSHTNNPWVSRDKAVLAFDRNSPDIPLVRIIDRQCEDLDAWKDKYGTLVQSIRMVSCMGENVWSPQPKKWSTAAIGIDHQERVLFIHVSSPFSMHDLINALMSLPIGISRAMYAEGGSEAQLYVRSGDRDLEFIGGYQTAFNTNAQGLYAWPIPNALGIARRDAPLR